MIFKALKWQCQEVFCILPLGIQPNWAPDKQAKMVCGKIRFRIDIQIFWQAKQVDILYQGKERPAKTKFMPAEFRTVLVSAESDSEQCKSILDFRKMFENI